MEKQDGSKNEISKENKGKQAEPDLLLLINRNLYLLEWFTIILET